MSIGVISRIAFAARLIQALETLCLIVADPVDDWGGFEFNRHASITISDNDVRGRLFVSSTDGMLSEIACGLLGVGPDEIDTEEIFPATVGELANIFGGELIQLLGGEDIPFRPGIPVIESAECVPVGRAIRLGFDAMGEGLLVTIEPELQAA